MKTGTAEKENNDGRMTIKINEDDLDDFKTKTGNLGKPYQIMLREIIKAFNEDRIRIIPTSKQKESLKIYQK